MFEVWYSLSISIWLSNLELVIQLLIREIISNLVYIF